MRFKPVEQVLREVQAWNRHVTARDRVMRDPQIRTGANGGGEGRGHHPNAFTMWMADGGIKPGLTLGQTDEFGFNATDDRVHVHDLHARLVHLLGFDHTKLTYRFQGRDFHLSDVPFWEVEKLLARGGPSRPNSPAHD